MKKFDLLFFAPNLREDIQNKMTEKKLTVKELCREATELGILGLNPFSISRFFTDKKGKREGSITQGSLIYILLRLGLEIRVSINDSARTDEVSIQMAKTFAKEHLIK